MSVEICVMLLSIPAVVTIITDHNAKEVVERLIRDGLDAKKIGPSLIVVRE